MANIKSQMKRNRQSKKLRARNKSIRSELKTRERRVLAAAEAGDAEKAEVLLREAQKRIDMATSNRKPISPRVLRRGPLTCSPITARLLVSHSSDPATSGEASTVTACAATIRVTGR